MNTGIKGDFQIFIGVPLRILIGRMIPSSELLATSLWTWLVWEELDKVELGDDLLKHNDDIELFELLKSWSLSLYFSFLAWSDMLATLIFLTSKVILHHLHSAVVMKT